jgi:hypothetical protein
MWIIDRTEEIAEWIRKLDEDAKEAILKTLLILQEIGPLLGRPYVDTIKESKHKNMKANKNTEQAKTVLYSYLPLIPTERQFFLLEEINGETSGFIKR